MIKKLDGPTRQEPVGTVPPEPREKDIGAKHTADHRPAGPLSGLNKQQRKETKKNTVMLQKQAVRGDIGKLKHFLKKGANPNINLSGIDNEEVKKILISHGADAALIISKAEKYAVAAETDIGDSRNGIAISAYEQAERDMRSTNLSLPRTAEEYFIKKAVGSDYVGEFNSLGAKRAGEFGLGLKPEDARFRTHSYLEPKKLLNTMVLNRRGQASLADGQPLQDITRRYALDPARGEFVIVTPENYLARRVADGGFDRKILELKSIEEVMDFLEKDPGAIIELTHHSTALGVDPVIENGRPKLDKAGDEIMQARSSGAAGYFDYDENRKITRISDESGHYRPESHYLMQAVEQLLRKGALFDDSVADANGEESEIDEKIYWAVDERSDFMADLTQKCAIKITQAQHAYGPEKEKLGIEIKALRAEIDAYNNARKYLRDQGIKPTYRISERIDIHFRTADNVYFFGVNEFLRSAGGHKIQGNAKDNLLLELSKKIAIVPALHEGQGQIVAQASIGEPEKAEILRDLLGPEHEAISGLKESLVSDSIFLFADNDYERGVNTIRTLLKLHQPSVDQEGTSKSLGIEKSRYFIDQIIIPGDVPNYPVHKESLAYLNRLRDAGLHEDVGRLIDGMVHAYQKKRTALSEKDFFEDSDLFLQSNEWLLESARDKQDSGDYATSLEICRDIYDVSERISRDGDVSFPSLMAESLLAASNSLLSLGRIKDAELVANKAAMAFNGFGVDTSESVKAYLSISDIFIKLNKPEEAKILCLKAMKSYLMEMKGGWEKSEFDEFYSGMGKCLEHLSKLEGM